MQYIILIYGDEKAWTGMSQAEMNAVYAEHEAYGRALVEAGAMRGGAELQPTTTATAVRVRHGKTTVTDGPFAETKEQLGGFYLIDVPDLDSAIAWAARCPNAKDGTIEVRPLGMTGEGRP